MPGPTRRSRSKEPKTTLLVLLYARIVTIDGVSLKSKMPRPLVIFKGQMFMVNPLLIRTWGMNFPWVWTVMCKAKLCFLLWGDKSWFEKDRLLWTIKEPIILGSCSGVESGKLTDLSSNLIKMARWGLESNNRLHIVICAWVFFNYSKTIIFFLSNGSFLLNYFWR